VGIIDFALSRLKLEELGFKALYMFDNRTVMHSPNDLALNSLAGEANCLFSRLVGICTFVPEDCL
jgi:hypothetical protein